LGHKAIRMKGRWTIGLNRNAESGFHMKKRHRADRVSWAKFRGRKDSGTTESLGSLIKRNRSVGG